MKTQNTSIGKFSAREINELDRAVRPLLNERDGGWNSNLRDVGYAAHHKLWELLDGRLTSEQLFALERTLAIQHAGKEALSILNIKDGCIDFNGWALAVTLDNFIEALAAVTAPFVECEIPVMALFVHAGIRNEP